MVGGYLRDGWEIAHYRMEAAMVLSSVVSFFKGEDRLKRRLVEALSDEQVYVEQIGNRQSLISVRAEAPADILRTMEIFHAEGCTEVYSFLEAA
jgi:hypothetical protein